MKRERFLGAFKEKPKVRKGKTKKKKKEKKNLKMAESYLLQACRFNQATLMWKDTV